MHIQLCKGFIIYVVIVHVWERVVHIHYIYTDTKYPSCFCSIPLYQIIQPFPRTHWAAILHNWLAQDRHTHTHTLIRCSFMDSRNLAGVLELSLALFLPLRSLRLRVAPGSCWHHDVRHYLTGGSMDKSAALPSWSQLSRDQCVCVHVCLCESRSAPVIDHYMLYLAYPYSTGCSCTPTIASEIQGWKFTLELLSYAMNVLLHLVKPIFEQGPPCHITIIVIQSHLTFKMKKE